ncbi:imm11 family protein [Archangium lansingense]|uniref:imm11 family protein n=1 Tax=Archangium lansingense TaxID=2995310 RepID=UPI003B7C4002
MYDHRERLYSRDYFIINPIGALDCLDEKASGVKYGEEGSVVDIAEFVLDPAKVQNAPALFRIDKKPSKYVVDERFVQAVEAQGFTNVLLAPLRMLERA